MEDLRPSAVLHYDSAIRDIFLPNATERICFYILEGIEIEHHLLCADLAEHYRCDYAAPFF